MAYSSGYLYSTMSRDSLFLKSFSLTEDVHAGSQRDRYRECSSQTLPLWQRTYLSEDIFEIFVLHLGGWGHCMPEAENQKGVLGCLSLWTNLEHHPKTSIGFELSESPVCASLASPSQHQFFTSAQGPKNGCGWRRRLVNGGQERPECFPRCPGATGTAPVCLEWLQRKASSSCRILSFHSRAQELPLAKTMVRGWLPNCASTLETLPGHNSVLPSSRLSGCNVFAPTSPFSTSSFLVRDLESQLPR